MSLVKLRSGFIFAVSCGTNVGLAGALQRMPSIGRGKSVIRGLFLENPENVQGPKVNFKIKTSWIVAQFLAHKPVNLASLTDSLIVLFFSELLKL